MIARAALEMLHGTCQRSLAEHGRARRPWLTLLKELDDPSVLDRAQRCPSLLSEELGEDVVHLSGRRARAVCASRGLRCAHTRVAVLRHEHVLHGRGIGTRYQTKAV